MTFKIRPICLVSYRTLIFCEDWQEAACAIQLAAKSCLGPVLWQCFLFLGFQEPPISIVGNAGMPEQCSLATGEDLILACETSSPTAAVRWLRNGKELVGADKRIRIEATGRHQQLTIRSVTPGESGSYVCDAGTDQRVTAVEVAGESGSRGKGLKVQEGTTM